MPATVLIVEDEPAILELVAVNLEHAGYETLRARTAEDAGRLLSDILPDVVLLDWMLPGQSGVALARRLRGDPRTISTSLDTVWVAKAIERIGDHAKNVAEQVIYIVKGTDVRHTSFADIEREIARG